MQWYYSRNGIQLGPITGEELKAKGRAGEVLATDLVWREGMADWIPFAAAAELQGDAVQAAPVGGSIPIPQPAAYAAGYPQQVPSYLWQSIVATVLGALTCWMVAMPLGIVAIVFAAKVDGLQRSGDIPGAVAASKSAKGWMIGSFACFALFVIFIIGVIAVMIATGELR